MREFVTGVPVESHFYHESPEEFGKVRRRNIRAGLWGALIGLGLFASGVFGVLQGPAAPIVSIPGQMPTSPFIVGVTFLGVGVLLSALMGKWVVEQVRTKHGSWVSSEEICLPFAQARTPIREIILISRTWRKSEGRLIGLELSFAGSKTIEVCPAHVRSIQELAVALAKTTESRLWVSHEI